MDKIKELSENLKGMPEMLNNLTGMMEEAKGMALKDLTPEKAEKLHEEMRSFKIPENILKMQNEILNIQNKIKGLE